MNSSIEEFKHSNRLLLYKYLEESKDRLDLIFNRNDDAILAVDLDGDIVQVNPAFVDLLGYTVNEALQIRLQSLISIEDLDKVFNYFHKSVLGRFESFDCKMANKMNEVIDTNVMTIPISASSQIIGVYIIVKDITLIKQKRAEEDLRKWKKALREIIEHTPDGVVIIKNNKIQFINETGIKLFGASKESEIINKSILDFVHPDYHPYAIVREKDVSSGKIADYMAYKMRRLDGNIFEAEVKSIPTIFENNDAIYIYIRDLTERKKTQELLFQADKLNIAGQFAASIAHEIRNPLTAIKGFLKLLESEIIHKKNYFDIVQSEMGRIELILSELLALAKPKVLNMGRVELRSLINDVKTLIDAQAIMHNISLNINFKFAETLPIHCDKNQLKQVLINFLKNSIEAMEKDGLVIIELERYGLDKIKILIKDSGTGIPLHILKRLGEPFFTTKENGTGLGIMISKQIIENHKGSVQIFSNENGTTVEIILPIN
jgi:two-component system, sporulation sensor kinase A